METEEQAAGVGEYQSKLAEVLNSNARVLSDAFLYSKKRHDVSTEPLARGVMSLNGLREACKLTVHCMNNHEDREHFAKTILEVMNVK